MFSTDCYVQLCQKLDSFISKYTFLNYLPKCYYFFCTFLSFKLFPRSYTWWRRASRTSHWAANPSSTRRWWTRWWQWGATDHWCVPWPSLADLRSSGVDSAKHIYVKVFQKSNGFSNEIFFNYYKIAHLLSFRQTKWAVWHWKPVHVIWIITLI